MALSTSEAIFLGTFSDADTDEATAVVEDASVYLGTFGSVGAPLHAQQVDVTYDDVNDNGQIGTDNGNPTPEPISYDLGSGPVSSAVDSLAVVDLTVVYTDGTSVAYTNAVMFQDALGNLFLTNSNFAGTDLNSGYWSQIESIQVTNVQNTNYTGLLQNALQSFVCFAAGTQLLTPARWRAVETLGVGDLLMTEDRGAQPVRWIGDRAVRRLGAMRPVLVKAGALGGGLPVRDLRVSQQHRLLVRSVIVQRMTDTDEVLVAAKALVGFPGIMLDPAPGWVRYLHVLMDRHEVIFAEGAPVESLLPATQALKAIGPTPLAPAVIGDAGPLLPARKIVQGKQRRTLVARHIRNSKRLVGQAQGRPVSV